MLKTDFQGKGNNCVYIPAASLGEESIRLLLLPSEIPFFLLKSKKDEFLFTDQGLIFQDGDNINSPKRRITRTNFCEARLADLVLTTAGIHDNDLSIEFRFGSAWKIEMAKEQLPNAQIVMRCLEMVSMTQTRNAELMAIHKFSRQHSSSIDFHITPGPGDTEMLDNIHNSSMKWADTVLSRFQPLSFAAAFERVLNV